MFVPRVVKKKIQSSEAPRPPVVPPASALAPPLPPPALSAPTTNNSASPVTSSSKPQAGSEAADIECAAAIELLFSDYNLSLDPDELHLSARMGRNNGFVSLQHVLSHRSLEQFRRQPQLTVHCALKAYGTPGFLQSRITLTEPASYGGSRAHGESGFEIGRIGWTGKIQNYYVARPNEVYVENFPSYLHNVPQILVFLNALLGPGTVQSLVVPPPNFRGFAFITLRDSASTLLALDAWSWSKAKARGKRKGGPREAGDACAAGLRMLPKTEYERLEAEYLDLLHSAQTIETLPAAPITSKKSPAFPLGPTVIAMEESISHARPDFPPDCLLFLKNLSPSTNKTAIKDLVNGILRHKENIAVSGDWQVGYVDWSKGADSAHLRLPHPSLAPLVLAHFTSHAVDASSIADAGKTVTAELVTGERERIYWMDNVKEPLRRVAVDVALGVVQTEGQQEPPKKKRGKG